MILGPASLNLSGRRSCQTFGCSMRWSSTERILMWSWSGIPSPFVSRWRQNAVDLLSHWFPAHCSCEPSARQSCDAFAAQVGELHADEALDGLRCLIPQLGFLGIGGLEDHRGDLVGRLCVLVTGVGDLEEASM